MEETVNENTAVEGIKVPEDVAVKHEVSAEPPSEPKVSDLLGSSVEEIESSPTCLEVASVDRENSGKPESIDAETSGEEIVSEYISAFDRFCNSDALISTYNSLQNLKTERFSPDNGGLKVEFTDTFLDSTSPVSPVADLHHEDFILTEEGGVYVPQESDTGLFSVYISPSTGAEEPCTEDAGDAILGVVDNLTLERIRKTRPAENENEEDIISSAAPAVQPETVEPKVSACMFCKDTLVERIEGRVHLFTHTLDEPVLCPICQVNTRMKGRHAGRRCGDILKRLRTHVSKAHLGHLPNDIDFSFVCGFCASKFKTLSGLSVHLCRKHYNFMMSVKLPPKIPPPPPVSKKLLKKLKKSEPPPKASKAKTKLKPKSKRMREIVVVEKTSAREQRALKRKGPVVEQVAVPTKKSRTSRGIRIPPGVELKKSKD